MKNHRKYVFWAGCLFVPVLAAYAALGVYREPEQAADAPKAAILAAAQKAAAADGSYEQVQELFNTRCILCHSCNNAPCQLKLSSFEGLDRGASKIEAIHPTRLKSIPPTRLGIDARSAGEWHKNGFFPVAGDQANFIIPMLNQGPAGSPADTVAGSHSCPANISEMDTLRTSHPEKLMPYGLPPLSKPEREVFISWVDGGRKPPVKRTGRDLSPELAAAKSKWEEFLNRPDLEHRLVARYLYEHLFFASLHFGPHSRQFHRIVRSRTPCGEALDEIATRRPSDDPGEDFRYCFKLSEESVVEKTLLPYLLDEAKLNKIQGLFFDGREPWKASRWPEYRPMEETNPFILYQDIPVSARYRFLLEDAQYHVATFIKGPVCYGRGAVSSIDEHFFVFFMNPDTELMVADPTFAKASEALLVLPFSEGSDAPLLEKPSLDKIWDAAVHRTGFTEKYIAARNGYVALKDERRRLLFKQGYALSDLWDGDGTNPNAVLTVFRHFDHSYVLKGLRGGEATSYFILDYGLFERLVYNLVVGYDVFGNVSHQLHTRLYMEMLRREAEDNFLTFLPPQERARLRGQWYQKEMARLEQKPFLDPNDEGFPTRILYRSPSAADKELIQKLGTDYLSAAVRGPYDGTAHSEYAPLESIAQKPASAARFVRLFPDTSLVLIAANGHLKRVVTVIRDRAHSALGRFMLESTARVPEQDRLAVVDGIATSYPNLFFLVAEDRLPDFLAELNAVNSRASAQAFLGSWAVLKTNPAFWAVSDQLHAYLEERYPMDYGVLDYTRYGIWTEAGDWGE
jgi:hypothetical protein